MLRLLLCLLTMAVVCPAAHAMGAFLPEIKPLPADASLELKRREAEWLLVDRDHLLQLADAMTTVAARSKDAELQTAIKKWAANALKVAEGEFFLAKAYKEEIRVFDIAAAAKLNRPPSEAEQVEEKPSVVEEKPTEVRKTKILKATLADGTVVDGGEKQP